MITKLLWVVFLINIVESQHVDWSDWNRTTIRREERNLTCIPHGTQLTCDCKSIEEKLILYPFYGHTYQISISNCKHLTIKRDFISYTQGLGRLSFSNVKHLVLEEYALSFQKFSSNTPLKIEFNHCELDKIHSHAITGNIVEIVFNSVKIASIQPFAFTSFKEEGALFKFNNVQIGTIEAQAFKKFSADVIEFNNCNITENIPSKAFYDLEVSNRFKIHNSTMKEIHSKAFFLSEVGKLILTSNKIEKLDGEWIAAYVMKDVLIQFNRFRIEHPFAFRTIFVHKEYTSSEKVEIRFTDNTIYQDNNSIKTLRFDNKFQLTIKNINWENQIDCNTVKKLRMDPFFAHFAHEIYFSTEEKNTYRRLSEMLETDCAESSNFIYILSGSLSLLLLIIFIAIIIVYICSKQKKRKLDVVMPEARTYRETQIVLQIENAGLLKTDL